MKTLRQTILANPAFIASTRINDQPWSKPKGGAPQPSRLIYSPFAKFLDTAPISTKEAHEQAGHDYAVDFLMPIGTPLYSTCRGTVVELVEGNEDIHPCVRSNDDNLNYMIIKDQQSGLKHMFAHLQQNSARFKVGDTVRPGDMIAKSGHNGASTQPHLHFGVYKDDQLAQNIWKLQSVPIILAD